MIEGYVVKYFSIGFQQDKALFLDKVRAEQFATQWHGQVYPLIIDPQCLSKPSVPLSTTNVDACLPAAKIATSKPTP